MATHLKISGLGTLLLIIAVAGLAQAENRVELFSDLHKVLKVGQGVAVGDESGQMLKGKVEELLPSSIVIRVKEGRGTRTQSFTESQVTIIKRTAHIWDGAVRGAAIGAGIVAAVSGHGTMPGSTYLAGAGVGAAIGLGIDAAFVPPTVYVSSSQKRRVQLTPLFTKDRAGMLATLRF